MSHPALIALERQLDYLRVCGAAVQADRVPPFTAGVLRRGLPVATPIYLARTVSNLLATTEPPPDAPLDPRDLPTPCGFLYLGHPRLAFASPEDRHASPIWIDALLWEVLGTTGVAVTTLCTRQPGTAPRPDELLGSGFVWPVGRPRASAAEDVLAADGTVSPHAVSMITIAGFLAALWAFMGQRLAARSRVHADRALRHRASLTPLRAAPFVEVVELRARDAERPGDRAGEALPVDWSCRWIVRPHWRQQWYPSEDRHKPVLVAAYVKGPPEKPLKTASKLFAVVR
jgi:hypothetical protein